MVGGCTQTPLEPPDPYLTTELQKRASASSDLEDWLRPVAKVWDATRARGVLEQGRLPKPLLDNRDVYSLSPPPCQLGGEESIADIPPPN